MRWIEDIRGRVPLHRWSSAIVGSFKYCPKYIGTGFSRLFVGTKGTRNYWFWEYYSVLEIMKFLIKKLSDPKYKKEYFRRYAKTLENTATITNKVNKTDLRNASDKELTNLYKKLFTASEKFYGYTMDIDAVDEFLDGFLKKEFNKSSKNPEDYTIITTPSAMSYVKKVEFELCKLAQKITDKKMKSFLKKYWWVDMGWGNIGILDEKKVKEKIREFKDADRELKKLQNYEKEIKNKKNKIIKKYRFNKKFLFLLELFEKYAILHDLRKETQMKKNHAFYNLIKEISRRKNIKTEILDWAWNSEVVELLEKNRFNKKKIAERKNGLYIMATPKDIVTISGKKAISMINKIIKAEHGSIEEFEGMCASPGNIKGRVKIAIDAKEAATKIKQHNILVTGMTAPDFTPFIKNVKAIVTDEGGITCHAAIVSREMNIPCIVATKIATKVLKDNMLVEVDANRGIVRILKRNN